MPRVEQRAEDRADLAEAARVLVQLEPQVRDLAVAGAADGDLLQLGAAVAEAGHRLAAGLLEPHRAADLARQHADQQLLAVAADLGAEPAADVGGQDPHLVGADACGCLAIGSPARPGRAASTATRAGDRRPTPPRQPRGSSGQGATRWFMTRSLTTTSQSVEELGAGVRRAAHEHRVEHGVAAGGLVDVRVARQRLLEIDQRRQRIDVGDHRLGGVGRLLVGLGDDRRDRLADPAHLAGREQRAGDARVERRRLRLERQGSAVWTRDHAGHALGRRWCRSS